MDGWMDLSNRRAAFHKCISEGNTPKPYLVNKSIQFFATASATASTRQRFFLASKPKKLIFTPPLCMIFSTSSDFGCPPPSPPLECPQNNPTFSHPLPVVFFGSHIYSPNRQLLVIFAAGYVVGEAPIIDTWVKVSRTPIFRLRPF